MASLGRQVREEASIDQGGKGVFAGSLAGRGNGLNGQMKLSRGYLHQDVFGPSR